MMQLRQANFPFQEHQHISGFDVFDQNGQRRIQVPIHTQFHQPHVLVPANPYLHEEIPIWLRVYFKANPSLDNRLKFDMFLLPELECFEAMLNRLLRDELEELVMRYEALRVTISQEIDHRAVMISTSAQAMGEMVDTAFLQNE